MTVITAIVFLPLLGWFVAGIVFAVVEHVTKKYL